MSVPEKPSSQPRRARTRSASRTSSDSSRASGKEIATTTSSSGRPKVAGGRRDVLGGQDRGGDLVVGRLGKGGGGVVGGVGGPTPRSPRAVSRSGDPHHGWGG